MGDIICASSTLAMTYDSDDDIISRIVSIVWYSSLVVWYNGFLQHYLCRNTFANIWYKTGHVKRPEASYYIYLYIYIYLTIDGILN